MGRLQVTLMILLSGVLVALAAHSMGVTQAQGKLRHQLDSAATEAASHPDASPECRAAQSRAQIIISNWPTLWWEDGEVVRSRVSVAFDNSVALKREQIKSAKPSSRLGR